MHTRALGPAFHLPVLDLALPGAKASTEAERDMVLAALAMFVWVNVEPGAARAVAYDVMLVAGVSTLVFNVNPLLRFDGASAEITAAGKVPRVHSGIEHEQILPVIAYVIDVQHQAVRNLMLHLEVPLDVGRV